MCVRACVCVCVCVCVRVCVCVLHQVLHCDAHCDLSGDEVGLSKETRGFSLLLQLQSEGVQGSDKTTSCPKLSAASVQV